MHLIDDPETEMFLQETSDLYLGKLVCIHVLAVLGPIQPERYLEAFVGILEKVGKYAFVLRHMSDSSSNEDTFSSIITQHIVAIAEINAAREVRSAQEKNDKSSKQGCGSSCASAAGAKKGYQLPKKPKVTDYKLPEQ